MSSESKALADNLQQEVVYQLRSLVGDALKFQRHSKSPVLTTNNMLQALRMRGEEAVFGINGQRRSKFVQAMGSESVVLKEDPFLSIPSIQERGVYPHAPKDKNFQVHWLAIDGIQPLIPENQPLDTTTARGKSSRSKGGHGSAVPKKRRREDPAASRAGRGPNTTTEFHANGLPIEHSLSAELTIYRDKCLQLLRTSHNPEQAASPKFKGILKVSP